MVRIAYRTSSGIYGPKDRTFPRAVDVETQLKRGRLREHSLKKCISVLLVVVAFCMCGLIVGLLSSCEEEDNLDETNNDSDLKPIPVDIQRTGQEGDETTTEFTGRSTTLDDTAPLTSMEWSEATTLEDTENTTAIPSTTQTFEITENTSETVVEEDSTTQDGNLTSTSNSVSLVYESNELTTIETLSNIKESVPTCYPPHYDPKFSSGHKAESPGVLADSRVPVQSEPKVTSIANNLEVEVEASGVHFKRSTAGRPVPSVSEQSEPIVKVSFLTTPPDY